MDGSRKCIVVRMSNLPAKGPFSSVVRHVPWALRVVLNISAAPKHRYGQDGLQFSQAWSKRNGKLVEARTLCFWISFSSAETSPEPSEQQVCFAASSLSLSLSFLSIYIQLRALCMTANEKQSPSADIGENSPMSSKGKPTKSVL